jgi:hypothetical protein
MKCTFCLGSFKSLKHSRSECSRADDTKRLFHKANRNWRREFVNVSRKIGFGVGCLMKMKEYGYWDPSKGWTPRYEMTAMVSAIPWDHYSFMCSYDGSHSYQMSKSFSFIAGDVSGVMTTQDFSFRNFFSLPEDWPNPYLFDGVMKNSSVPDVVQPSKIDPPADWLMGDWVGIDWLVDEYSYDRLQRADIIRLAEDWASFEN